MIYASIAVFALAAIMGLTIFLNWMKQKDAPKTVIFAHGILAATALILLIIYTLNHPQNALWGIIGVFVLAATGGFYMFIRNFSQGKRPVAFAIVPVLLAVGGFLGLLIVSLL